MSRLPRLLSLVALLVCAPARGFAASAVFNGDPVNPATGLPYEILPGFPLVLPGPDGLLGTADDTVDPATIGDIDLVVRSGSPAASAILPPPAAIGGRTALPVGIAGSEAAGGTDIPFTVFLSDGASSSSAPYGHLLAASDMNSLGVIVAAFADLDGDGMIGPTNQDDAGDTDNALEVRELEPVGRAVALFTDGVARGRVAVRTGLPASQGGLTVALTGFALTGRYDSNFFGGSIPNGPAITTAQPFLPQRDLTRLIRERPVGFGPTTTLQPVVRFAAIPDPNAVVSFALLLDGSSPTIDAAIVNSQAAVRAAFREDPPESEDVLESQDLPQAEDLREAAVAQTVEDVVLGTDTRTNAVRLLLVPVDRWDNPSDPPANFAMTLRATPPLEIVDPSASSVTIDSAGGRPITVSVPAGTPDGTTGSLTVERDGKVFGAVSYRVDSRINRREADLTVPSSDAATIQAAIDAVADRNGDGLSVIDVEPGVYRENIVVNHSIVLQGRDSRAVILQGDGSSSVLSATAGATQVQGLTVVGGTNGFAFAGTAPLLVESRAWRNLGAGISIVGSAAQVWRTESVENNGDGLFIMGTNGASCSENALRDNGGAGLSLSIAQNTQVTANRVTGNTAGGINLAMVNGLTVSANQAAANLGPGIQLLASQYNRVTGNLCVVGDDDGLHMDQTGGDLVSGNVLQLNKGVGLFVRRSTSDDFSAAPGIQAAPGDNSATDNRKGNVVIKTN